MKKGKGTENGVGFWAKCREFNEYKCKSFADMFDVNTETFFCCWLWPTSANMYIKVYSRF